MVHLAIASHSRVSFAQVLPDETTDSCEQFLRQAAAYYASMGVRIERVMTGNGAGYKNSSKAACGELRIRHIKPRPYTPKTNGKAERFVQSELREWAYGKT
ncbi:transposase family protein [Piscinibacter aquaticus]|uniref:Transposase family protein n=1 Tax=Piscinibacter aquaticus TaxID=392597 RepID=A0A5C6TNY7_9BURK|nr:transposase family protein [Piscinibacter aquaticus]